MREIRYKIIPAMLSCAIWLSGCSAQVTAPAEAEKVQETVGSTEAVAESAETEAIAETEEELFIFRDVEGEVYGMTLDRTLKMNDYDKDSFTGNGIDKTYNDEKYQTRLGIDVSKYQEYIDWDAMRDQHVEFAILRIGGRGYGEAGSLYEDPMFENHLLGAKEVGMDIGIYFFSQAITEEEAVEEANLVLELLEGRELELPIFYDEEFIKGDSGRADALSSEQLTSNAVAFCETIESAGYEAQVYMNMVWQAKEYDMHQLEKYGVWYADYCDEPQSPYAFEFWQFTESAVMDGVETQMDLNLQFIR